MAIFARAFLAALLLTAFGTRGALAIPITGFATMGASETQGTAHSGSWVPYLVERGIPVGPNQSYNRAIGGSTSATLLSRGQHTQVANLVQNGSVNVASIFIGGLDVPPVAPQILLGTLDVPGWAADVVGRITMAIDTVLAAGPAGMLVWGLPDMTLVPALAELGLPPESQAAIRSAVAEVNSLLLAETLARGLVFIDTASAMRAMNAVPLRVGGVAIDTLVGDPDPTHLFQDGLHPAVIGNGLFANLALTALNRGFGQSLALFSDQALLQKAGLGAFYTGETSALDYAAFVVPEPGTFLLLAAGLTLLAGGRAGRRAAPTV